MKNKWFNFLAVFVCCLIITSCGMGNKPLTNKEKAMKIIQDKGVEQVTWEDFSFLPHQDEGSGLIVEKYQLDDDSYLQLFGVSYDKKPEKILLMEQGKEKVLKSSARFDEN